MTKIVILTDKKWKKYHTCAHERLLRRTWKGSVVAGKIQLKMKTYEKPLFKLFLKICKDLGGDKNS